MNFFFHARSKVGTGGDQKGQGNNNLENESSGNENEIPAPINLDVNPVPSEPVLTEVDEQELEDDLTGNFYVLFSLCDTIFPELKIIRLN